MDSNAQNNQFKTEQKQLGQTIKRLRTEKGFTQESLAGEAQINVSYLAKIENGYINVSLRYLIKISKALQLKVADLFEF
jgi:transcriptional regulator with XRE-family HTH domain